MADQIAKASQYQYTQNSNLVLQADRSALPRRDQEPSGEPETLHGRINPKEFGSRAVRDTVKFKAEKKNTQDEHVILEKRKKRKEESSLKSAYGFNNVLSATDDFEGLEYRPRTKETRAVYELILAFVSQNLGDQPHDVIRSAADSVLEILKSENMKDFDKKSEIEYIINSMTSERFAQLISLGKRITDFNPDGEAANTGEDGRPIETIDEEHGVAVVFDEDEDEEGEDNLYEIKDDSEEEEEREEEVVANEDAMQLGDDGDEIVVRAEVDKKQSSEAQNEQVLYPHEIDAFWLQRLVATYYPDSHTAQEKTASALSILSSEAVNTRDCENELMNLFDYEHFELVKTITKNRDMIVWCTRLARTSEEAEKANIEQEMRSKGLDWILKSLGGERVRRSATRKGVVEDADAMDVDEKKPDHASRGPTKGLLDGSFKRSKKGYEEIHVPAPTPKPLGEDEKLVPINTLPEWSQVAFPGATSLNRIQSKLYPTAFGEDENVLLCAPTGAGKTNVAMLCVLRELSKFRDEATGIIDIDAFKIIYIAPMKALVQEMVLNFSKRLEPFGVKVAELTGDRQLTKQQIAETQMIVTTPEKWDVITPRVYWVTEKKAIKRFQVMNEVTYEKVMDQAGKNQILIFVHSRKETAKTARAIRDMCIDKDTIGQFLREDSATREILQSEAETVKDENLKDVLPYGFAIHHAGMNRTDRALVEDLFSGGHVQVLVSTATLAWGVNLPAHTVIIKGTQIYSPEKG
ncbi:hypothetical protein K493DRAFT_309247, partial [Basidiobolus meristosporus CBS 931.73]